MKPLYLCIFSLFLLGACNQVRSDPFKTAGNKIAKDMHSLIDAKKSEIFGIIEKELTSLEKKSDSCSLNKKHQIKDLYGEFKDVEICLNVSDVEANVTDFLNSATNLLLEIGSNAIDVVNNASSCMTKPLDLDCIAGAIDLLSEDLQTIIMDTGSVLIQLVQLMLDLLENVLGCLNQSQSLMTKLIDVKSIQC